MLLFAHVGITLGAAALISAAVDRLKKSSPVPAAGPGGPGAANSVPGKRSFTEIIGLKSLSEFMDIRLLLLGSLLPDIIDKPLAAFTFGNGRSLTHTLIITVVILFYGMYLYINHKKTWCLAIASGMIAHLILDYMWMTPETLLWPIYGWSFPSSGVYPGLEQFKIWWNSLTTNASVDLFEAVGFAILAIIFLVLVGQRGLKTLLVRGKIET
jgi:inner membrane protein